MSGILLALRFTGSEAAGDVAAPFASAVTPNHPVGERSGVAFPSVLSRLGRDLERAGAALHAAETTGLRPDTPAANLLALQLSAYRYGELVELASRLIDRGTSAVKTVLQGGGS
jgi:hypothetical protein